MSHMSEACWANVAAQVTMENTASGQLDSSIEGNPEPGIRVIGRCQRISDGGLRAKGVSGNIMVLTGCCNPDTQEKMGDMYRINESHTENAVGVGLGDLPEGQEAQATITNAPSGLHHAVLTCRNPSAEDMVRCEQKLEQALDCPHRQELRPQQGYWEDGDSDITVDGRAHQEAGDA